MASVLLGAAAGVAVLDLLSGNSGQKFTETTNVMSSMTVNAVTTSSTDCFQSVSGSQVVQVIQNSTDFIQQHVQTACAGCISRLNKILNARNALEFQANAQNPGYTPQVANSDLVTAMTTGFQPVSGSSAPSPTVSAVVQSLGPCDLLCHDVVLMNTVQNITASAQGTCNVDTTITNNIQQSFAAQVQASLTNSQDFLGQLGSLFTSNTQSISANLANDMTQNINTNFVQDLQQALAANQSVNITGHSIFASGLSQSFSGSMVGSLSVQNTVVDQLQQSAAYSIAQTLINNQNTTADILNTFTGVIDTIADLIQTLMSQIIMILGAILAAVIVVVGGLYIFSKDFRDWGNMAIGAVGHSILKKQRHHETIKDTKETTEETSESEEAAEEGQ